MATGPQSQSVAVAPRCPPHGQGQERSCPAVTRPARLGPHREHSSASGSLSGSARAQPPACSVREEPKAAGSQFLAGWKCLLSSFVLARQSETLSAARAWVKDREGPCEVTAQLLSTLNNQPALNQGTLPGASPGQESCLSCPSPS